MKNSARCVWLFALAVLLTAGQVLPVFGSPITISSSVNIGSILYVYQNSTTIALPSIDQGNYNQSGQSAVEPFLVQSNSTNNIAIAISNVTGQGAYSNGALVIDNVPWQITYTDCNGAQYNYTGSTASISIPGILTCVNPSQAGFSFSRTALNNTPDNFPVPGNYSATLSINVSQQ